ncbi:hypothetical protein Tco_0817588 [Tanacetum coccineum]
MDFQKQSPFLGDYITSAVMTERRQEELRFWKLMITTCLRKRKIQGALPYLVLLIIFVLIKPLLTSEQVNSGVTCEYEAKRRNSGAKTKTFEENCYLLLYAVSNKEDTVYQRQLITRIRVKDQFPIRHSKEINLIRRMHLSPYGVSRQFSNTINKRLKNEFQCAISYSLYSIVMRSNFSSQEEQPRSSTTPNSIEGIV